MKNTGTLYRSTEKTPTVFPEFRDLLPPLSQEQQEALERDILQNGCYSPLIVDQELRVVDGHNRLSICQSHEIPYTMLVFEFEDALEAKQFLNEHDISTEADMTAFVEKAEAQIKALTKQRTILNVQKKKRQPLFQALTDEETLAPAKRLYDQGHSGMEAEAQQYMDAVKLLNDCGVSREALSQQQPELYTKLADLNRELRQVRKQIKMCEEIRAQAAVMQENIREIEHPELEVKNHDKQR